MKVRTAIAFGLGYVLGARAGRERYEQLRNVYGRFTSNHQVQHVVEQGKDIVDEGSAKVRDLAADQLRNAGQAIRNKTGDS